MVIILTQACACSFQSCSSSISLQITFNVSCICVPFLQKDLVGHKNIVAYLDSNITAMGGREVWEVLILMDYCKGRLSASPVHTVNPQLVFICTLKCFQLCLLLYISQAVNSIYLCWPLLYMLLSFLALSQLFPRMFKPRHIRWFIQGDSPFYLER